MLSANMDSKVQTKELFFLIKDIGIFSAFSPFLSPVVCGFPGTLSRSHSCLQMYWPSCIGFLWILIEILELYHFFTLFLSLILNEVVEHEADFLKPPRARPFLIESRLMLKGPGRPLITGPMRKVNAPVHPGDQGSTRDVYARVAFIMSVTRQYRITHNYTKQGTSVLTVYLCLRVWTKGHPGTSGVINNALNCLCHCMLVEFLCFLTWQLQASNLCLGGCHQ